MTDKQIIIDGVDVSGCKCLIEDYQRANNFNGRYEHIKNVCELGERGAEYYNLFCKDNPNCYYKQLKRKEQECERLSSLIRETETYSDVCCECRDDILTYPTIAGRTDYTQIEVEERSLKKIIQQLNQLKKANDEKNELLAQLGCPTVGTARQLTLSLKEQLEAYKMEAEEGKEINAELKAENETLKQYKASKQASYESMQREWNQAVNENRELKQTLTEIKEIAEEKANVNDWLALEILQKISEVI